MHQLKSGLSRYVAQARAGDIVEITVHDKLVARLVGVPTAERAGVARLLATGAAQWAGGRPALRPPVVLHAGGKPLSELVLEDRG